MTPEEKIQLLIQFILDAASGNHTAFYDLASESEVPDEIDAIGVAFNSMLEEFRAEAEKKERDMLGWRRAMHDIRGPIGSIKLLSSVLIENIDKKSLDHEIAKRTLTAIIASTELMLDKLNYAIDSRRHSTLRISKIDIGALIDEAKKLLMLEIQSSQFHINVAIDDNFLLHSDRELLVSVFKNLIENAYKYRKEKEGGVMNIIARQEGHLAVITFSDDGIGIPSEKMDSIFEMYEQASEGSDGLGYGLYSVKRDIETLHGQISLSSEASTGTRIEIRFRSIYPDSMMQNFTNVRHTEISDS